MQRCTDQLPDIETSKDLIYAIARDNEIEEYVRRRSLLAIAPFAPLEAEKIAKAWMNEDYEYSRIAGIHVLNIVNSDSLSFYLERHKNDPNDYVRWNVDEIKKQRQHK